MIRTDIQEKRCGWKKVPELKNPLLLLSIGFTSTLIFTKIPGAVSFATVPLLSYPFIPLNNFRREIVEPTSSLLLLSSESSKNLVEDIETKGTGLIISAAREMGASEDQIHVEWKSSNIIVTVSGSVELSTKYDDGEKDLFAGSMPPSPSLSEDDSEYSIENVVDSEGLNTVRTDITIIGRAINRALAIDAEDGGTIGEYIAVNYEIEVTTPGISDILSPDVINVYRGFEVIVETTDKKTGKRKILECLLVGRDETLTKVNVKGRISKLKNEDIICVRLPKAKKEKIGGGGTKKGKKRKK